jgi:TRAP transporter 4TM/12TM fusion protein
MTGTTSVRRPPFALNCIYYAASVAFLFYMFYYYWTGEGGPTLLAMTMIPVTYVLYTLQLLRRNELYPKLPAAANYAIAAVYCVFALYCAYYMNTNYMALGEERAGMWDTADLVMGGGMTLLIIEYARKRHVPLFVLNIVLLLYAVYGYMVPGMFYHAGLSWHRVITASSVEMATGIFSRLPQIALTIIGSFLLVLSLLRGFGCVDSLLRATKRVAIRSAHAIPQSAVIGSMAIGTVSGSGAANSITVGSATIPAMINAGLPPATAAAIENASSMGGQLMPPVMGIAAFLMADFLGVDYFDVVARGWVPALIYYISVAASVYLLSLYYRTHLVTDPGAAALDWRDKVNIGAFVFVVGGLVVLMATIFLAPMFAALYMFYAAGAALLVINTVLLYWQGRWSLREFIAPLQRFLDSYIDMITDIALLLATLSIMAGALVITGVPTKIGALMVEAAGINMVVMVLMAALFGVVLGMGLPPAPTYILVAIVIAPAFIRIANASFYVTLWRSVQICVSLFTLMAAVFIHPELVAEPGAAQLGAALLVLISTIGITFSLQGRFTDRRPLDVAIRLVLAAFSLVVLLDPDYTVATAVSVPIVLLIAYWVVFRRNARLGPESAAAGAPAYERQ